MQATTFPFSEVSEAFPELIVQQPALGIGSFKVAYRAADRDGFNVVLKILLEPIPEDLEVLDSSDLPERFARELNGMDSVSSPFVVRLLKRPQLRQIGTRSYMWYLEPFYPGGTLEKRLAEGHSGSSLGRLILKSMLQAVADMWEQAGMVHRDIKPGNIVFDELEQPVLLDLGIAFHKDLTALTDAYGPSPRTPRYAAPEQFEMRRIATIDFRTDLFLVGMVSYESFTGKHPFWEPGIDTSQYHKRISDNQFDRAALESACSDATIYGVILRLLAPRPSGRFRDTASPLRTVLEVTS